jgi:hypothetical protein
MNKIKKIWDSIPVNIKRYILDSIDVFLATFLSMIFLSFSAVQQNPELTFSLSFWYATLTASALASIKSVLKYLREVQTGYLKTLKEIDKKKKMR